MNETSMAADGRHVGRPRDPIFSVIEPAVKAGVACGGAGFLFGGAAGIIKGTAPFLFASASALQTFALGTTFYACRGTILEAWATEQQIPQKLTTASTISGGITGGAVAAAIRGRSNIIPGALMFSLFGFLGQTAYNRFSIRAAVEDKPKQGFWRRMSERSFSPVTVMSDEAYTEMLREKMLKVDVEISILDDKIIALKQQQQEEQAAGASQTQPPKE